MKCLQGDQLQNGGKDALFRGSQRRGAAVLEIIERQHRKRWMRLTFRAVDNQNV